MNDLSDAEVQIIYIIRNLKLFDKMEIKFAKQGELLWQLTTSSRGTFDIDNQNTL
jgi:hypothetical protein